MRWDALLAHATQVDPESPFWFGLPREVASGLHPWDEYVLAASDGRVRRVHRRPLRRHRRSDATLARPQDWLDRQRAESASLPERPGATALVQYEVTGGPDGTVVFHTQLEDGRIVENALGADDDADFTMLLSLDEFVSIASGDEDPTVGYMQGRVKVTGNIGRMLSVLPVTTSTDVARRHARRGRDRRGLNVSRRGVRSTPPPSWCGRRR